MDGLGGTDSGQVTVTLIGEHEGVGVEALDSGGDCGSAAVGGLLEVDIKVVVGQNGASDGAHADDVVLNAHLVDNLGDEAVGGAVTATGAVVHDGVGEHLGTGVNLLVTLFQQRLFASFNILIHCCSFLYLIILFSRASRTSPGVGMIPPKRPKCSVFTPHLVASFTSSII